MSNVSSRQTRYPIAVVQWVLHGINDNLPVRQLKAENARRVAATIERICTGVEEAPRIIVFPVLMLSGIGTAMRLRGTSLPVDRDEVAFDLLGNDPVFAPVIAACAKYHCYVCSSGVEKVAALPGRYFHTGYVFGPDGLVVRSPKVQAPTSSGVTLIHQIYDDYVAALGEEAVLPVAETPLGRIGCLVEGEMQVAEAVRVLRRKGVDIVLHAGAQHSGPGTPPMTSIKQAQAYMNGVYIASGALAREVVDNRAGRAEAWFGGGATVIGPDGSVLTEIQGADEGFALATIDLDAVATAREHQDPHTKPAENVYSRIAWK